VPGPTGGTLTVRVALELPALRAGAPEVVAGADSLDNPVRWVHVAERPTVSSALSGGELLISEGNLFSTEIKDRRFIAELAERGVAGFILELGEVYTTPPRHIVQEFESHGIPLILLHVQLPFIEVTEAVHRQLVSHELVLLEPSHRLQDRLTKLLLTGGGIPDVLEVVSDVVGNPVVLEREHGGFGYHARSGLSDREIGVGWEQYIRQLDSSPTASEAPVVVGGQPEGRLVALGLRRPVTEEDRVAVVRAADLIGLAIMRDRHQDSLAARAQRGFLTAVQQGDVAPHLAETRAAAVGFQSPVLLPLSVTMARHHRSRPVTLEDRAWRRVWDEAATEFYNRHMPLIVDQGRSGEVTLAVLGIEDVTQRAAAAHRAATIVMAAAERHLGEKQGAVLSVGPAVHTWHGVAEGLQVSIDALDGAVNSPPRPWHDATDLDLDRLLWSLRENPDLERFARLRLDALIQHDKRHRTQLLKTLRTLLDENGRKAETARVLHLERQSLYNRVERIEAILGVDLSDADARLGLHLALRVLPHVDPRATS
jgi:purine catabolism regulator